MKTWWISRPVTVAEAVITIAATVVVLVSIGFQMHHVWVEPQLALAFGGFIALGELARVNLPDGGFAVPLASAGALAYALVGDFAGRPTQYVAAQVVVVTAIAMSLGSLPYLAAGKPTQPDALARRVLMVAIVAAVYRPLFFHWSAAGHVPKEYLPPIAMAVIVMTVAGFDALLAAWTRSARDRSPYLTALRDEVGALFGIGTAIGATGILIALASVVMGIWALPVFAIPLIIAQFSLRRFAVIRQTHRQTIQALSRVTEVGGYTDAGHSWRVSELGKAVGRELGLSSRELFDLEQAALMHDIGQLSLPDPIPGGATTMASGEEQRAIAERGAEVIRATGALTRVADIVACQAEPYRRPGEPIDASIPLASRIIRVVNAYDDLAGGSLESERRLDALDQLRLNMAYDYDPTIVDCLTRVVGRSTFSNA